MKKIVLVLVAFLLSSFASDNNSTVEWGESTIWTKTWPSAALYCAEHGQRLPYGSEVDEKQKALWFVESNTYRDLTNRSVKCVKVGDLTVSLKTIKQSCQEKALRLSELAKRKEEEEAKKTTTDKLKDGAEIAGNLVGRAALLGAGVFFAMMPASAQAGGAMVKSAFDTTPGGEEYTKALTPNICSEITVALQKLEPTQIALSSTTQAEPK